LPRGIAGLLAPGQVRRLIPRPRRQKQSGTKSMCQKQIQKRCEDHAPETCAQLPRGIAGLLAPGAMRRLIPHLRRQKQKDKIKTSWGKKETLLYSKSSVSLFPQTPITLPSKRPCSHFGQWSTPVHSATASAPGILKNSPAEG
jgi:hypothetical protein